MVRVEYGEKPLGESAKVECTTENPAEINYNANISVTFEDPMALDEISYKPVLCRSLYMCISLNSYL